MFFPGGLEEVGETVMVCQAPSFESADFLRKTARKGRNGMLSLWGKS